MEVIMSVGCKEGSKVMSCTSSLTNIIDSTASSKMTKGAAGDIITSGLSECVQGDGGSKFVWP